MQCIQLQIRDEVDCNVLLMYKFKIQSLHILYKWKNHFHEMNGDVGMAGWK